MSPDGGCLRAFWRRRWVISVAAFLVAACWDLPSVFAACGDHLVGTQHATFAFPAMGDAELPPAERPCSGPGCRRGQPSAPAPMPVVSTPLDKVFATLLTEIPPLDEAADWLPAAEEVAVVRGAAFGLERPPRAA